MRDLLIVDLQDITSIGLTYISEHSKIFSSINYGRDKSSILNFLKKHANGVVVLDYTMVDVSVEFLIVIHSRYPEADFILFSDSLVTDFIKRVIYSSTRFSIILKDTSRVEIEVGLSKVAKMNQFICEKVANQILISETESCENLISPLTATEREILKLLAMGKTTKDIASMRFLSVNTVMTHRKNIFRKLSVNNVHEATRYAIRAGLVDPMEYYI